MILLSHPTGNEFVRQAIIAFDEAGLLAEFWTTLSWNPNKGAYRLLPRSLRDLLKRRSYPASVRSRIRTVPLREIGRLLAGIFSMDEVCFGFDEKVATRVCRIDNCNLVYAYEDAALRSFQAAAKRGIFRAYDLPIGYWRVAQRTFAEEKEREPEWASTLTGMRDSPAKLERKDEELRLAQRVIVASTFTKKTLIEAPTQSKIDIIPYGAPAAISSEVKEPGEQLRVLFAGELGQRKGLSYLLKAIDMVKRPVELTLLGRKAAHNCRPLEASIRKYRWIPTLNHAGVLREMSNHDLLVFPSLFEGFGLVILEAMAQGTPVITTEHTAGPDIIDNDVDGFIVPIRSAEAIAEKIDMLSVDGDRLMAMKMAARRKAELHPWAIYRQRLVEMAREVIAG